MKTCHDATGALGFRAKEGEKVYQKGVKAKKLEGRSLGECNGRKKRKKKMYWWGHHKYGVKATIYLFFKSALPSNKTLTISKCVGTIVVMLRS